MRMIFQRELTQTTSGRLSVAQWEGDGWRARRHRRARRIPLGVDRLLHEFESLLRGQLVLDDAVDAVVHGAGHCGRDDEVGLRLGAGDSVGDRRVECSLQRTLGRFVQLGDVRGDRRLPVVHEQLLGLIAVVEVDELGDRVELRRVIRHCCGDGERGGCDVHDDVLLADTVGELRALPEAGVDPGVLDGARRPHSGVQHRGVAARELVDGLLVGLSGHVRCERTGVPQLRDVLVELQEVGVVVAPVPSSSSILSSYPNRSRSTKPRR